MMTTESEPIAITFAGEVLLEAMCEIPVIAHAQVVYLVKIISIEHVASNQACITENVILNWQIERRFCAIIASRSTVNVKLPKHQNVGGIASALHEIIHFKKERHTYNYAT